MTVFPGAEGYEDDAPVLVERYEALQFDQVHLSILHLIPAVPSRILDVGAGTGRDAAGFARLGHDVVAVEPTQALRQAGMERHASPRIVWIDDGLPLLRQVRALAQRYDVIMLTAVWMHLDTDERRQGMDALSHLLSPGGVAIFMLRHGPVPPGRRMFSVTWEETASLGATHGLRQCFDSSHPALNPANRQAGVTWSRGVLQRPF